MKRVVLCCMLLTTAFFSKAQQSAAPSLYDPNANAEKDIQAAIATAAKEHKNVFLQIGGNWCVWCLRYNKFVTEDAQLDSMVHANYVVYHMNYSQENKNTALLEKYDFPQRFGFPVFVILNPEGKRIHTQNSAYLEEGSGYNRKTVMGFLKDWSPASLDPAKYKK